MSNVPRPPRPVISKHHTIMTAVLSHLDETEAAILRVRMRSACQDMLEKQELVKRMFQDCPVTSDQYLDTMKKIVDLLDKYDR